MSTWENPPLVAVPRAQRLGQVEADLGGQLGARLGAGVQAGAGLSVKHKHVAVALEAGRHGPFDRQRVVDIDVGVDHKDVLAGAVPGESRPDGFAAVVFVTLCRSARWRAARSSRRG